VATEEATEVMHWGKEGRRSSAEMFSYRTLYSSLIQCVRD